MVDSVVPDASVPVFIHLLGVSDWQIGFQPSRDQFSLFSRSPSLRRVAKEPKYQHVSCFDSQRSIASVQCANGLHHGGPDDVELRGGRDGVHPLEGSAAAAAGLSHCDQRAHGAHLHQVPSGLDHVDGSRHHLHLG